MVDAYDYHQLRLGLARLAAFRALALLLRDLFRWGPGLPAQRRRRRWWWRLLLLELVLLQSPSRHRLVDAAAAAAAPPLAVSRRPCRHPKLAPLAEGGLLKVVVVAPAAADLPTLYTHAGRKTM